MNATRRFSAVIFILIILSSTWGTALAQADVKYFPETGHYVRGAFLQEYNAAKDPALVYGNPLTEQMTARDGKTVQYFNNARFELSANNTVTLTPLGRLMYQPQNLLTFNSASGCQPYPTGYNVCFTFLDFYKANGENHQFGYPISSLEYDANGMMVQYFEGARLERRTGLRSNDWIVITDLGRRYFDLQREDPAQFKPAPPPDATIKPVLSLNARAFVLKAVTLRSGSQSVYVIVRDQTSQTVSNATVEADIRFSDGTTSRQSFQTDSSGIGTLSFTFDNQKPGELITIRITIRYQGLSTTTATSFRIWF